MGLGSVQLTVLISYFSVQILGAVPSRSTAGQRSEFPGSGQLVKGFMSVTTLVRVKRLWVRLSSVDSIRPSRLGQTQVNNEFTRSTQLVKPVD
ncbi:hypothetical protein Hanom_Chr00s019999g01759451 [Helianthus anomalus]